MKKLLPFLIVFVYLTSGKILKYPDANICRTTGGDSPLFGADSPDTVLQVIQGYEVPEAFIKYHEKIVASFNLRAVERWEVK